MTLYYSATTGGFYDSEVHVTLPANRVEITTQQHKDLLTANAQGASIAADEQGYPQAIVLASNEALAPQPKRRH